MIITEAELRKKISDELIKEINFLNKIKKIAKKVGNSDKLSFNSKIEDLTADKFIVWFLKKNKKALSNGTYEDFDLIELDTHEQNTISRQQITKLYISIAHMILEFVEIKNFNTLDKDNKKIVEDNITFMADAVFDIYIEMLIEFKKLYDKFDKQAKKNKAIYNSEVGRKILYFKKESKRLLQDDKQKANEWKILLNVVKSEDPSETAKSYEEVQLTKDIGIDISDTEAASKKSFMVHIAKSFRDKFINKDHTVENFVDFIHDFAKKDIKLIDFENVSDDDIKGIKSIIGKKLSDNKLQDYINVSINRQALQNLTRFVKTTGRFNLGNANYNDSGELKKFKDWFKSCKEKIYFKLKISNLKEDNAYHEIFTSLLSKCKLIKGYDSNLQKQYPIGDFLTNNIATNNKEDLNELVLDIFEDIQKSFNLSQVDLDKAKDNNNENFYKSVLKNTEVKLNDLVGKADKDLLFYDFKSLNEIILKIKDKIKQHKAYNVEFGYGTNYSQDKVKLFNLSCNDSIKVIQEKLVLDKKMINKDIIGAEDNIKSFNKNYDTVKIDYNKNSKTITNSLLKIVEEHLISDELPFMKNVNKDNFKKQFDILDKSLFNKIKNNSKTNSRYSVTEEINDATYFSKLSFVAWCDALKKVNITDNFYMLHYFHKKPVINLIDSNMSDKNFDNFFVFFKDLCLEKNNEFFVYEDLANLKERKPKDIEKISEMLFKKYQENKNNNNFSNGFTKDKLLQFSDYFSDDDNIKYHDTADCMKVICLSIKGKLYYDGFKSSMEKEDIEKMEKFEKSIAKLHSAFNLYKNWTRDRNNQGEIKVLGEFLIEVLGDFSIMFRNQIGSFTKISSINQFNERMENLLITNNYLFNKIHRRFEKDFDEELGKHQFMPYTEFIKKVELIKKDLKDSIEDLKNPKSTLFTSRSTPEKIFDNILSFF